MTDPQQLVSVPGAPSEDTARGKLFAHLSDPLYRTGYLLMVGTGITSAVGFVFWAVAAHAYSPRIVGLSSALIAGMAGISGICTLGLEAVLVRYLPTAGSSARSLIIKSYGVTVAFSLALSLTAALASASWSPKLRFLAAQPGWFIGFALATAAWTVFTLQDSVLTGLRSAHWVAVENSTYSVVKLVLLVALAGSLPRAGPFVAWTAPVGLGVFAVTALVFRGLLPRHADGQPLPFDRRTLVRVAAGNYGGTLCAVAGSLLLPVLVAYETNLAQTAFFYLPWTITAMLRLIALNMMISLTVEGAIAEQSLTQLTRRAFVHTMRLVLPLVAVCALAAPWVLSVFGPRYAHAGAELLRFLAIGSLPNVVVSMGMAVARVRHRAGTILAIQAAEGVVTVGISIVLLPVIGINGVGLAWTTSQFATAAVLIAGPLRPMLAGRGERIRLHRRPG
jgi:O-antigen/teichoic acid export membrane protein